ncbi:MAG: lysophospholipase [Nannocystaceae bacterium]|nr:lysophospholipase [Nannocystaceae bacterium]
MDILFCHGLESAPHGAKYQALADAGLRVLAPDCREQELGERVALLSTLIAEHRPRIVVGSSYGGIAGLLASLVAREQGHTIDGLLMCAPALALPNPDGLRVTRECPAPTVIIHAPADAICPFSASETFAKEHGARLISVEDDHRLSASLPKIVDEAKRLLKS